MATNQTPDNDAIARMASMGGDIARLLGGVQRPSAAPPPGFPAGGEFSAEPTGIAADRAKLPRVEKALGEIPSMRATAQEELLKGTQAKTVAEATAKREAAKMQKEGLEDIYKSPEVQQQTIEFKPSRMEMEDYKALAGLLVGAAAIFGAGGKGASMYALSALDGMMKGYNQGRSDLFKQQAIEFDKAMKSVQEKNKQALDALGRMKENLVAKTNEFSAIKAEEIAKNSGGILSAQLRMSDLDSAEKMLLNMQTGIEKRITAHDNLMERIRQQELQRQDRLAFQAATLALRERSIGIQEKKGQKSQTSALLAGRAENIREAFAQAAQDIVNITKFPPGTMLGAFAGLTGASGDTLIKGLRNSLARNITDTEQRMLQQLVAGIEGHLAFALGGGYATSQSKARMDQYKEQIARAGDEPANAALFLARLKQEMGILAENFASKPGASEEMNNAVQKYNQKIQDAVPFDVDDVIQASLGKVNAKGASETKPSGGWQIREKK